MVIVDQSLIPIDENIIDFNNNGSVDDVICDVSTESAEHVPSEETNAGLINVQTIKQEVIDDEYENVYNQYLSQWTTDSDDSETEITCPIIKQEVIDQEYHLSQWDDRVPSTSWEATYTELTDQRINEDDSDDDEKYIQYLR
ncbi:uncharacterized protein LOC126843590 [Adelges cooleyi]|uniref:uncharacterized protein LOC126843590 n=1 Tax=Adelges cooleyi TaxID=133065 RepID=UPI00217F941A|nr:uncharacterized protein LOC126843590 [Adelges cooleyi]